MAGLVVPIPCGSLQADGTHRPTALLFSNRVGRSSPLENPTGAAERREKMKAIAGNGIFRVWSAPALCCRCLRKGNP